MASVLTIGGSTISRASARIVLNTMTLSLDGQPDELAFTELNATLPGSYAPEETVTLTDGTTTLFSGWIFSRESSGFGQVSGRVGYRALGLSYGASLIAITASDGTGTMAFNLPITDPYYSATESGLSVGTIISQVIAQHSTQLTAMGISTDSTTTTQLSALTIVPPEAIYIAGNSLWGQLLQFLQQWYGNRYALRVEPSGLVRCWDTLTLTTETITLDTDPAILSSISEDTSECYTQVVLRGRDDVEPVYLSLHDGTLVGEAASGGGWTAAEQGEWTIADYLYPQGGYDQGKITALTSTVVTVQSDYAAASWPVNYWSGIQGQINCINPVATGIDMTEYRHITADSALTAGGTATITVDRAFAATGYTRYQITGIPSGLSQVWRKYMIPNTYIAEHLVEQFNFAVPFSTSQSAVAMTTGPAAVLCYNAGGGGAGIDVQIPVNFEVVPYDGTNPGYLLFFIPTCVSTNQNTQATLEAGGTGVVGPTDIIALVPYSRGTLTVTSPSAGGYSGTAYSRFSVERTLYRDYPTWIDAGNSSSMQELADLILSTVSNAVQEGSVTYFDRYAPALPDGSWPIALNLAKATGTTGYESMGAPVRRVELTWPQDGAAIWTTTLHFTTRRQMFSGEKVYVHPMYLDSGAPLSGVQQTMVPPGYQPPGGAGYVTSDSGSAPGGDA